MQSNKRPSSKTADDTLLSGAELVDLLTNSRSAALQLSLTLKQRLLLPSTEGNPTAAIIASVDTKHTVALNSAITTLVSHCALQSPPDYSPLFAACTSQDVYLGETAASLAAGNVVNSALKCFLDALQSANAPVDIITRFCTESIRAGNYKNFTPLFAAVSSGRSDNVDLLLQHGATLISLPAGTTLRGKDYSAWTPLDRAIEKYFSEDDDEKYSVVINMLLTHLKTSLTPQAYGGLLSSTLAKQSLDDNQIQQLISIFNRPKNLSLASGPSSSARTSTVSPKLVTEEKTPSDESRKRKAYSFHIPNTTPESVEEAVQRVNLITTLIQQQSLLFATAMNEAHRLGDPVECGRYKKIRTELERMWEAGLGFGADMGLVAAPASSPSSTSAMANMLGVTLTTPLPSASSSSSSSSASSSSSTSSATQPTAARANAADAPVPQRFTFG